VKLDEDAGVKTQRAWLTFRERLIRLDAVAVDAARYQATRRRFWRRSPSWRARWTRWCARSRRGLPARCASGRRGIVRRKAAERRLFGRGAAPGRASSTPRRSTANQSATGRARATTTILPYHHNVT
jgi:hypothetical protein